MRVSAVLVALVLVGACTPAPRELTPKEVLDRSADALDKATTAHFVLEQQNGSVQLASGVEVVNAEGDVQRPDRMSMKFNLRLAGFSAEAQLIAVGEDLYITNPLSKQWQKVPSTTGAPRVLDKEVGFSNLLRQVTDPSKVGNETLDGVQTQHLKGRVPAASFTSMLRSQATGDTVAGDVWVGNDDFLPRQVRLEGTVGTGDTAATVRVLKFSKFNDSVSIERPS
jgi:LppX_LprAFG lipoprotein